jgi:hypothetical protein
MRWCSAGGQPVTQWFRVATSAAGREAEMGNKDKGGRASKKSASKGLKEKRAAKKAKKAEHETSANQSLDKTFGH